MIHETTVEISLEDKMDKFIEIVMVLGAAAAIGVAIAVFLMIL